MGYEQNHETVGQQIIAWKPKVISNLASEVAVANALTEFRAAYQKPPAPNVADLADPTGRAYGNHHGTNGPSSEWETGRRYMTRAGFRTRSKVEKIIADFLYIEGFKFLYEPLLQIGDGWISPDFYFTELQLPYEHFGMNTPEYRLRAETKIVRYVGAGIPFVYTTFNDEPDLEDVLTEKLVEFY